MNKSDVDVLIIGGGPAGLSAAVELRKQGVKKVLLVEREQELGGIPRHCHHTGFGWFDLRRVLSGPAYAKYRTDLFKKSGAEYMTETSALSWSAQNSVKLTGPQGLCEISASAVLLATGCRERPRAARLIPGMRPSGIHTTGSLQQQVYLNGKTIGKKAVVVGAEHVSFSAVHTLISSGTKVVALVDQFPKHQSYSAFKFLTATLHRVPMFPSCRITNILGRDRLEAIEITDATTGTSTMIECDTLVFTGDWIPANELIRLGDIALDKGTHGPQIDLQLRTSREGVFAAGNLLHGAEIADVAGLEGRAVALPILNYLNSRQGSKNWRKTSELSISLKEPIQWISPNVVTESSQKIPSAVKHFHFRVKDFNRNLRVIVRQGNTVLHAQRFTQTKPNFPYKLSATWTEKIIEGGPRIEISAD